MNTFNNAYNNLIMEQSQDLICEGIVSDIFNKIKQKLSKKIIVSILNNRLSNVKQTQKLKPDQLSKLKKLENDAVKYQNLIKYQTEPIHKLKKSEAEDYLEQAISDMDKYLIRELGSWWKNHLLKQNEIKKLAKTASLKGLSHPLQTMQLTEHR